MYHCTSTKEFFQYFVRNVAVNVRFLQFASVFGRQLSFKSEEEAREILRPRESEQLRYLPFAEVFILEQVLRALKLLLMDILQKPDSVRSAEESAKLLRAYSAECCYLLATEEDVRIIVNILLCSVNSRIAFERCVAAPRCIHDLASEIHGCGKARFDDLCIVFATSLGAFQKKIYIFFYFRANLKGLRNYRSKLFIQRAFRRKRERYGNLTK